MAALRQTAYEVNGLLLRLRKKCPPNRHTGCPPVVFGLSRTAAGLGGLADISLWAGYFSKHYLEKDIDKHSLYLPASEEWVDAWDTNKVYEGGQKITIDTPLYKIPIFIRKGAEVVKVFEDTQKLYDESLAIAKNKPNLKELEKTAEW